MHLCTGTSCNRRTINVWMMMIDVVVDDDDVEDVVDDDDVEDVVTSRTSSSTSRTTTTTTIDERGQPLVWKTSKCSGFFQLSLKFS